MPFYQATGGDTGPLDEDELAAALQQQIEAAQGFYGDTLGTQRAELMSVYLRHGYVEDADRAENDLSTSVDSTAQDSVDQNMEELLRMFSGADDAVTFKSRSADDAEKAEEETDVVHHVFYTQNQGYLTLQSWLWDGMVAKNGFVKCYWQEKTVVARERYSGLTNDDLTAILEDLETDGAKVEIVDEVDRSTQETFSLSDIEANPELQERVLDASRVEQVGANMVVTDERFDVRLKITSIEKGIKIKPIPPDEVLISNRWKSVDLQGCPFVGHRYLEDQSTLIAEGLDPDQIALLPESHDEELGQERTTRFDGFDLFESSEISGVDQSTRAVLVTDCYVYVDLDGDGIAELVKVRMGGADGQILQYADGRLAIDEIEECEIHAWTPFIIPHRHFGQSVVERVQDIQRNRSVAERNMQDNLVISNNTGSIIGMDQASGDTVDDALTYRPGRLIRAKTTEAIKPLTLPPMFQEALPVLKYWEERGEVRTGATRLNRGLTSDNLAKNVPGVVIAQLQEAGMAKIDMIARNFAETGYQSLFRHIHALLRRHQNKKMSVEVRGKWIDADPRAWGPRSEMTVGVGLGANGKLARLEGYERVIKHQTTAMQAGVPLTSPALIYNALSDMTSSIGFKNTSRYFQDPSSVPPAPPPDPNADPAVRLAEAELEVGRMSAMARLQAVQQKEAKDQRDFENRRIELEMKGHEVLLKDDRERDIAVLKAMVADQANQVRELGAQLSFMQSVVQPPAAPAPGQIKQQ